MNDLCYLLVSVCLSFGVSCGSLDFVRVSGSSYVGAQEASSGEARGGRGRA